MVGVTIDIDAATSKKVDVEAKKRGLSKRKFLPLYLKEQFRGRK